MRCADDCRLCAELAAVEEKACTRKTAYGAKRARTVAEQRNRSVRVGPRFQAYRCVFTEAEHWHVGHGLGWDGVEHLAALLRHRSYPDRHPKDAA